MGFLWPDVALVAAQGDRLVMDFNLIFRESAFDQGGNQGCRVVKLSLAFDEMGHGYSPCKVGYSHRAEASAGATEQMARTDYFKQGWGDGRGVRMIDGRPPGLLGVFSGVLNREPGCRIPGRCPSHFR
ncbi:MAG: hypothetical protein JXB13_14515 [Phycisphaerae bacterium]|nr:hypothetical protein [Phycisphaerae bacterium]